MMCKIVACNHFFVLKIHFKKSQGYKSKSLDLTSDLDERYTYSA